MMLSWRHSFSLLVVAVVSVILKYAVTVVASNNNPMKIFILAGQSNMVGMGSIDHLDVLMQEENEFRNTLWNGTNYKERSDVYMKYDVHHGKLTVSRHAGYAGGNAFGPEVLFGWTIGDAMAQSESRHDNPDDSDPPMVLLVKVAYGGRSLAVDFRPPSAGEGSYRGVKPIHYGWEYRIMMQDTLDALDSIATYVPHYNVSAGYELAGFVWFQGWNDMLDWDKVNEYEANLIKFIEDVRLDLDAPNLPFGTIRHVALPFLSEY
jgi:hypothetical protein